MGGLSLEKCLNLNDKLKINIIPKQEKFFNYYRRSQAKN